MAAALGSAGGGGQIDGSSNIDVNVSVGTIFSIYKRLSPEDQDCNLQDFLQKGTEQVAAGYVLYVNRMADAKAMAVTLKPLHHLLMNKYFVDEIYEFTIIKPLKKASEFCWKVIDVVLIDGAVLGVARVSRLSGEVARLFHTGSVQVYAVFMLTGVAILLGYFIYGLY